ncbi:hypothetical protein [Candidatus Nitrosocosmicus sp. FF01]|uniref:hypothetical protein n=1 Tax=Candidatus Nitrosocosmicus sp. FF01 TaxID=3397670 RepID=UPI0039EADFB1
MESYEDDIEKGNFDPIRRWLRLKIHQYGSTYAPKVLLQNSLNEDYDPDYFIAYLGAKCLIHNLSPLVQNEYNCTSKILLYCLE